MKILVFPFSENPYQTLLYTEPAFKAHTISYLKYDVSNIELINRLKVFYSLLKFRLDGYSVFHLHWLYNFSLRGPGGIYLILNTIYLPLLFIYIKLLGYKFVWTVHNITPHEQTTSNDLLLTKFISYLADHLIVHSEENLNELEKISSIRYKSTIIPIGSYGYLYRPTVSIEKSREELQIPKDSFVYLFFGQIKQYKGLDRLITAFTEISKENAKAFLIIVGDSNEPEYKSIISNLIAGNPKIVHIFKHLDDRQLSNVIISADVITFPFIRITTSSSVIYALSTKKPVIAPYEGSIAQIPNDAGYFYSPNTVAALKELMLRSYEERKTNAKVISRAEKYISNLSWDHSVKKTIEVYRHI